MATNIDYLEVQNLMKQGAQLIEVMPEEEFAAEHLENAISLPLKNLNAEGVRILDKTRPVIVYCFDYQ